MPGQIQEALRWSAPSALTVGALLSGLSAVRFASEKSFNTSAGCVMLAAVLDGLDGHVARYLGACSKLGFELDSLCDLANFGVSPALIVYFWAKALPVQGCGSEGCWAEHAVLWTACCAYTACCAFRLARFNVAGHAAQMDEQYLEATSGTRKPPVPQAVLHNFRQRKLYFQGVPAPVAAAYALTPLMFHFSKIPALAGFVVDGLLTPGRRGTAITLVVTAVLMVSPLPTFSSKMLKTDRHDTHLRSRHGATLAAKAVAGPMFCVVMWRFPFDILLLLNVLHLFSIPVAVTVFCCYAVEKHE